MTPRHNSDKDLYGKLKNGDLESFDAIFDRFYPALCAYGAQFVSLQDAENIVQDVMLWLWENREGMMIENALGTYLFRAVKNRCLTLINRGAIRSKVVSDLQQSMREKFDSPDFYVVEDLAEHLEAALAELPPTYRQAFEMNRFQGKSYKEIADTLGLSPKTVDYRIQQALKRLRVALRDFLPILGSLLYLSLIHI